MGKNNIKNFCIGIPVNPFTEMDHLKKVENQEQQEIIRTLYTIMRDKVMSGEWQKRTYETIRNSIIALDEKFLQDNYAVLVAVLSLSNEEANLFTRHYDQMLESHLFESKYFPEPGNYQFVMKNKSFSPNDCVLIFKEIYSRLVLMPANQLVMNLLEHKNVYGILEREVIDDYLEQINFCKQALKNNPNYIENVKEYYWQHNEKYLTDDYLVIMLKKMEALFLREVEKRLEEKFRKASIQRKLANRGEIELKRYEKTRYNRQLHASRKD
ncbi:MAG TPA: hypothetical protein IAB56_06095 [Candidatus Scybalousia intestinigallinarum]|nr:hypothetical protein [Candidatus Scybalousia intestinigallinarum]